MNYELFPPLKPNSDKSASPTVEDFGINLLDVTVLTFSALQVCSLYVHHELQAACAKPRIFKQCYAIYAPEKP